jgi:hypothetical protein
MNRRFAPLVRKLKEEMATVCEPGQILDIRYDVFRVNDIGGVFSGGTLHAIDAVPHLAGPDYAHVRCAYQRIPRVEPTTYNVFMECMMCSGARAHINNLPTTGVSIERATVNSHGHTFFLELPMWFAFDLPGRLVHVHDNTVVLDIAGSVASDGPETFQSCGFYYENVSFFDDLRLGRIPSCDIASVLQSMEVKECMHGIQPEFRSGIQ